MKRRCRITGCHMAHSLRLYLVPLHGYLLHGRMASSPCCLALDSSSTFPCPAFLAITKSISFIRVYNILGDTIYHHTCKRAIRPSKGSKLTGEYVVSVLPGGKCSGVMIEVDTGGSRLCIKVVPALLYAKIIVIASPIEFSSKVVVYQLSGTWHIKAMVCDKNHTEREGPKKVFPMMVTALEGGDLEVTITFWKKDQCHEKKIVMHKTDKPDKYTAFRGKKAIYIHELSVKNHYILYCEGHHHGKSHRMAKLVGRDSEENPEAVEEFKKFARDKGFRQENIFVPEQRGQCIPESD
ncbi:hypothetical protein STEG23_001072 [Scotinomys teguina]